MKLEFEGKPVELDETVFYDDKRESFTLYIQPALFLMKNLCKLFGISFIASFSVAKVKNEDKERIIGYTDIYNPEEIRNPQIDSMYGLAKGLGVYLSKEEYDEALKEGDIKEEDEE